MADEKNVDISIIYNKKILSIEDMLLFEGDRMFLQNTVNNLLKNAIEASPPDQRVKIKIKDTDNSLWLSVHNWGTIPEDVRTTFFEKHTTSGKKRGMGIGTYMASLVAKAHNGEITFYSSEDKGTEVSMRLPLS
jgi:signal transduction histidine kinase